jgi:biotin synthase
MLAMLDLLQTAYQRPLLDLLLEAQTVHRQHHAPNQIQLCTLSNIKSGKCPEDCGYCPQSAHYKTEVEIYDLPSLDTLRTEVLAAKANGSQRFCMGAAWRTPPTEAAFQQVLNYVRLVAREGMEACVTLGMLNETQARALKAAGLTAYNHNLDTSPSHYGSIITTRTYEDRLETLGHVSRAGLQVCCGGILGLGETVQQRLEFLAVLCQLETPPESVPVNALVPVPGTPMADQPPLDPIEMVRFIAVTRLFLPSARIRLSAGRLSLSPEAQALCFMAGANSIFTGEKLLTTPNPGAGRDAAMMASFGLKPLEDASPVAVEAAMPYVLAG